ncbi:MAG: N-acetylmuramoyl-L-alanine amidase [Clostridia bacterium]|nr:N-acetylmuramoyl-L-alanine amidase [Clostridia bacterium]
MDGKVFIKKEMKKVLIWQKLFKVHLTTQHGVDNKRQSLPISNIYLMDNSKIPSTIIECGFLSNPQECSLLQDDKYQNKLAWGIYTGIIDFLNLL